jgi:integrase
MSKIDIHNFKRRLSLVESRIQRGNISRKEKDKIYDFENWLFAQGLGIARITKYMQSIKRLYDLSPGGLSGARQRDIIGLLASIERYDWKAWTKHDHKLTLRKYLVFTRRQDLADLIRLPPVHNYKLPDEILTADQVKDMIASARKEHDRAFIMVLWESGLRIGELLTLQKRLVSFDSQGAVLIVEGKTGQRRVRISESADILNLWIARRSLNPESRIFPHSYAAYRLRIRTIARRSGLDLRVYPHLFRHSRATFLCAYLTEAQLSAFMGWTIGSSMARIYVHLSGHDLDAALANIPPVFNMPQAGRQILAH